MCLNQCDYPGENGEPCRCELDAQREETSIRSSLIETAKEWEEAKQIIAKFLQELNPGMDNADYQHNAAAVLARLAQANILTQKVKP